MNDFQNQSEALVQIPFRMQSGAEVLAEWSETASQTRRNAVYAALFSLTERTLFRTHQVIDDDERPAEIFVAVKENLVIKVRVNDIGSFDVLYVGAWETAPGFEFGRVR